MKSNNNKNSKRKRGGQPGNTNALNHGFYSRRFSDLLASRTSHPMVIKVGGMTQ